MWERSSAPAFLGSVLSAEAGAETSPRQTLAKARAVGETVKGSRVSRFASANFLPERRTFEESRPRTSAMAVQSGLGGWVFA